MEELGNILMGKSTSLRKLDTYYHEDKENWRNGEVHEKRLSSIVSYEEYLNLIKLKRIPSNSIFIKLKN